MPERRTLERARKKARAGKAPRAHYARSVLVAAATFARLDGARLLAAALVFGAVFPTRVAWFLVAPLKGQPMAAGFVPMAMAIGPIVNGAWGLGTGIGLALFGRPRAHRHP